VNDHHSSAGEVEEKSSTTRGFTEKSRIGEKKTETDNSFKEEKG